MVEYGENFDLSEENLHWQFEDEDINKKMDQDLDYAFALMLQSLDEDAFNEKANKPNPSKSTDSTQKMSLIDEQWEVIDPTPNIYALFQQFNADFFWGMLESVVVNWSKRMTLCAGVCYYERVGFCSIKLSQPLLQLRPRKDLVETLLHEMIHAYLFVTNNNKDRDGHGPEFLSHMNRINALTGTRISVYHSFHDEVDYQRKHWWKCDGPCQKRRPYFGIVKRAMNRAPSSKDPWWKDHEAQCGGTFSKIKEPLNFGTKPQKVLQPTVNNNANVQDIRKFVEVDSKSNASFPSSSGTNTPRTGLQKTGISSDKPSNSSATKRGGTAVKGGGTVVKRGGTVVRGGSATKTVVLPKKQKTEPSINQETPSFQAFSGVGQVLGHGSPSIRAYFSKNETTSQNHVHRPEINTNSQKVKTATASQPSDSNDGSRISNNEVQCPVCRNYVNKSTINEHLDNCLIAD